MNELARLDSQLANVVESDAVSIPVEPVIPSEAEGSSLKEIPPLASLGREDGQISNPIRSLDQMLVDQVTKQGPKRSLTIPVRLSGQHVPSHNVVELGGLARKLEVEERSDDLANIHEWTAPFEEPPAVDALAAYAGDLHISPLNPHEFVSQFTPGSHDVAYHESYRWWSKLRAPFIVWERRIVRVEKKIEQAVAKVEDKVVENVV